MLTAASNIYPKQDLSFNTTDASQKQDRSNLYKLDEGCEVFNNSNVNDQNGARTVLINLCVVAVLNDISKELQASFDSAMQSSSQTDKPEVCGKLKEKSVTWVKTGKNEGCWFTLRKKSDSDVILEKINNQLTRTFKCLDREVSSKEIVNVLLYSEMTEAPTRKEMSPTYTKLVSDVSKKIDIAFKEFFPAEQQSLNNLAKFYAQRKELNAQNVIQNMKQRIIEKAIACASLEADERYGNGHLKL